MPEETRTINEKTGGQKGSKIQQYALIPTYPLAWLAEMYGRGAQKYEPRNWEKGYDWSLSYSACQRHLNAFWGGEDLIPQNEAGDDPTAGVPHLTAAAWHTFAMLDWSITHPELDDRVKPQVSNRKPYMVLGEPCDARTARRKLREHGYNIPPEA